MSVSDARIRVLATFQVRAAVLCKMESDRSCTFPGSLDPLIVIRTETYPSSHEFPVWLEFFFL